MHNDTTAVTGPKPAAAASPFAARAKQIAAAKLAEAKEIITRAKEKLSSAWTAARGFVCAAAAAFAEDVRQLCSFVKRTALALGNKAFPKNGDEAAAPAEETAAPAPDGGGYNRNKLKRIGLCALSVTLALLTLVSGASLAYAASLDDERIVVTLEADGATSTYRVHAMTVAEFLNYTQTALSDEDELSAELTSKLTDGQVLTVKRAVPLVVTAKDEVHVIKLVDGTVSDALRAAEIYCDADDELSHMPFEDIAPGMVINYSDVEITYNTSYTTLEFEEIVQEDPNWYEGNSEVIREGSAGSKQITQRIIIRDGKEVSRRVVDQVVLTPAVDRILRVGTRIRLQTSLRGEWRRWRAAPTEDMIKEVMYVQVTAYTHTGNTTAMGTWPCLGTMAVNPRRIPYYSKIYVPGYGYGTALDTGGFRWLEDGMINLIDLFMDTEEECVQWGRKRNYKVYILEDWVYVPRHP
ncbi:MAG: G5 domain-containing protein [Clostridia bacterium]|nr:G5 domain-containing protein [Clostridia bacterium]